MSARPARQALLVTLAAALVLAVLSFVLPTGSLYAGLPEARCDEYCEASTRCGPIAERPSIQQPLNAWSNLAYLFVGALAIARSRSVGALLFGGSCAVLFLGSFLFHAALVRPFQWLDVMGMYLVMNALVARGVHDVLGVRWSRLVPGFALASAALGAYKWQLPTNLVLALQAAAVGATLFTEVREGRLGARAALLPFVLFGVAWCVRELDVRHVLCWPENVLYQGHALWHLLAAATLHALWLAYETAVARRPLTPG